MKKVILFLVLSLLLSGIAYATYLYIQELNPTWERRAGLLASYKTVINKDKTQGNYSYKSKTGTVRLLLSKDKRYEIYLKREGVEYLYSKGAWNKTVDESVFPERVSYLLESEKIEASEGEFRFRHHEMKGLFFDPQKKNAPIKYYVHFPKKGLVYETWEFRIQKEGLLDIKTNKMYKGVDQKTSKGQQTKPNSPKKSATNTPKVSTKERHEKANIIPTSIQKIKNKVEAVYDCKGGYGAMTVRLVLLRGMEFEIHVVENDKEFLYSKGIYAGGRRISLNGEEIAQEYAAYRLEKHSYHGTLVNDTESEDGMKAIRKIAEVWKAKTIFETWIFRKTDDGNFLDVNDKKVFVYNKALSQYNIAALK
jgi:hypothetical protein